MVKKHLKLIVFSAVFIVGLVILLNSIESGRQDVSEIMQSHGGSMDTAQYLIFLEASIVKHRYLGSIIALVGGLGAVLTAIQSPTDQIRG